MNYEELSNGIAGDQSYHEALAIIYTQSKIYEEKMNEQTGISEAVPGQWYIGKEYLLNSKEVKCFPVTMKYKIIALNSDFEFVASIEFSAEEMYGMKSNPRYIEFLEKYDKDGNQIQKGPEVLMYLTEHERWATFFMKKKLSKYIPTLGKIMQRGAEAGEYAEVVIKTVPKKYKKFSWFEIDIKETGEVITAVEGLLEAEQTFKPDAPMLENHEDDGDRVQ